MDIEQLREYKYIRIHGRIKRTPAVLDSATLSLFQEPGNDIQITVYEYPAPKHWMFVRGLFLLGGFMAAITLIIITTSSVLDRAPIARIIATILGSAVLWTYATVLYNSSYEPERHFIGTDNLVEVGNATKRPSSPSIHASHIIYPRRRPNSAAPKPFNLSFSGRRISDEIFHDDTARLLSFKVASESVRLNAEVEFFAVADILA
ncbi:hypothetical protein M378DRAFT_1065832 [Amanita muscaria Koide BX008]|uniref:Uncharacterized protein n=1 Tax=Amanita muscaria (strain Koide BX008) TaxID=946122 RepID=A0A0C2X0V7_AMAMK|nr:hypothetical protein M378DRAFT_1065832 [Amanita muscaria Koide BX008]